MIRRRALTLGLPLLLILWALASRSLERTFEQPLAFLYAWLVALQSAFPQTLLWAIPVGLFGLLALRMLPLRGLRGRARSQLTIRSTGSLSGWHKLLADRNRGAYFAWRLARKTSQLVDALDPQGSASADPEIEEYLRAGRTARTHLLGRHLDVEPESIVRHLEGIIERS